MFTKGEAIEFIEKSFGEGISSNQGLNISVLCPKCLLKKSKDYSKKKLVIRTDNFMCHCWVCGYKSRNLIGLLKEHRYDLLRSYIDKFADVNCLNNEDGEASSSLNEKLSLPTGWVPLSHSPKLEYVNYLKERLGNSIEEQELERFIVYWKFGYTIQEPAFAKRLILPSFDENGELNYFTGRAIEKGIKPKYFNAKAVRESVIVNELNIDWTQPLTVVEGPFDLIKCNWNATCLLGSEITSEYSLFLKILKNNTHVILALDPDAHQKTEKIAALLHSFDIAVSILDIPSQFKDVGEMTHSQFMELLPTAKPYSRTYSLRTKIANMMKVS